MGRPSILICLCMTLIMAFASAQVKWSTEYGKHWEFTCPKNQFISYMKNAYSTSYVDRIWEFRCQKISKKTKAKKCSWSSEVVNHYQRPMFSMCPENHALAGIRTEMNHHFKDRLFKLYCCQIKGKVFHSCGLSAIQNNYAGAMTFTVEKNTIITGIFSGFNVGHKDRSYQFTTCVVPAKKSTKKCL